MGRSRIAQAAVAAWVEYHQNVPMLVQIFLWYFGIATLLPKDLQMWLNRHGGEFTFATIAIGLATSAYMSESLRGGIRSIPPSQIEAARALGLSYLQAFRHVIFPQAFRIALPTMINHTVLLFKNTALAMTIGVAELMYATREIESRSFRTVEIYLVATAVYLGISLLIMAGGSLAERRLRVATR
jgi:polar amino acid transport system permease protein